MQRKESGLKSWLLKFYFGWKIMFFGSLVENQIVCRASKESSFLATSESITAAKKQLAIATIMDDNLQLNCSEAEPFFSSQN